MTTIGYVYHLVVSPQAPCGWSIFQKVESSLFDDKWIEKPVSVGLKRDLIWNLLPEEKPVPPRLQYREQVSLFKKKTLYKTGLIDNRLAYKI